MLVRFALRLAMLSTIMQKTAETDVLQGNDAPDLENNEDTCINM